MQSNEHKSFGFVEQKKYISADFMCVFCRP